MASQETEDNPKWVKFCARQYSMTQGILITGKHLPCSRDLGLPHPAAGDLRMLAFILKPNGAGSGILTCPQVIRDRREGCFVST